MTIPRRDSRGRWDLGEAVSRQRRLRERVVAEDRLGPVHRIAGADVSYDRRGSTLYAAAVLLDAETLHTIATASVVAEAAFPYLPGFLALREAPAVAEATARSVVVMWSATRSACAAMVSAGFTAAEEGRKLASTTNRFG